MDNETKIVLNEQQLLSEVTNHEGWKIVERKYNEFKESLRDSFDLDTKTATSMLKDLQARKYCYLLMEKWMSEIKGSAEVVENNKQGVDKTYIVKL